MRSFTEASRDALARMGRMIAEGMVLARPVVSQPRISATARRYVQPLRLIPGMPAAPEPCCLPVQWKPETHTSDCVGQLKVDGIRALYVDTSVVSREALPLDCALHCLAPLHDLEQLYGEQMVFDGEYLEPHGFGATLSAMRKGVGMGTIWLFDAVPYAEWRTNRFTQPLDERIERLEALVQQLNSPFVRSLPITPIPTAEDAQELAEREWARGNEGVVVKRRRGVYVRGRGAWQKIKQCQTFDGPIVDALVKNGRAQAIMVLLPADSPMPGKVVKIGTNIPEEMREAIARNFHAYQDTIAEIGFTDTNDTGALRGGYFIRVRPDKKGDFNGKA